MTTPPEPLTLVATVDPATRRYLLQALLLGRRELLRNGHHPTRGADRFVATLAAHNGPGRPELRAADEEPDAVLMDYSAAGIRLGVSARTVRRLVATGELQPVRIRGRVLLRRADLDAYKAAA